MPKELYHFYFQKSHHSSVKLALSGFFIPLIIILGFLGIMKLFVNYPIRDILYVMEGGVLVLAIMSLVVYVIDKWRGGSVGADEFIIYDNGWFVFWDAHYGTWIAPAKLEWVYPDHIDIKPLHIVGKYNEYNIIKRKKKDKYKVSFRLIWAYPDKKWENWVFYDIANGWLTKEEFERFSQFLEFLRKKGWENIKSGSVKIPGNNPKQGHLMYYQLPPYWNEVFEKENIRELYKKETGEDLPGPIRSFLFDIQKFDKVYLKNKKKTGDWFGRKGGEKQGEDKK